MDVLEREDRFVVVTHESPDGDAAGSTVAFARHLRDRGKSFSVLLPSALDERFEFLARDLDVQVYEPMLHESVVLETPAIVVLDTSQWNLLGRLADPISRSPAVRVVIDHHRGPSDLAQVAAIDPDASSTAELVYDLLQRLGATIDGLSAASLFTALATDTGWFRFQRVGPDVFRAAADLLSKGISAYDLYTRIFESRTWPGLRLLGETLEHFQPRLGGRAAFLLLDRPTYLRIAQDPLATEAVLDFGLSVREVEVCALLREGEGGRIKISIRSKGRVDVAAIAGRLGGGGHHNASGVLMDGPLGLAADRLERVLQPVLEALSDR